MDKLSNLNNANDSHDNIKIESDVYDEKIIQNGIEGLQLSNNNSSDGKIDVNENCGNEEVIKKSNDSHVNITSCDEKLKEKSIKEENPNDDESKSTDDDDDDEPKINPEESEVCKDYVKFLNTDDSCTEFDLNKFAILNTVEYQYCAKKYIEICLSQPHKQGYLTFMVKEYQMNVQQLRIYFSEVKNGIRREMDKLSEKSHKNRWRNLGLFIGCIYFLDDLDFISEQLLNDWMVKLMDFKTEATIDAMLHTIKSCSWIFNLIDKENFEKYLNFLKNQTLNVVQKILLDEIEVEKDEKGSSLWLGEPKPIPPTAAVTSLFPKYLNYLKHPNGTLKFNYRSFHTFTEAQGERFAEMTLEKVLEMDANVFSLSKFIYRLTNFEDSCAGFLRFVKFILDKEINNIEQMSLKELKSFGFLIIELTNLRIIEKSIGFKLHEKLRNLNPIANHQILDIYLKILRKNLLEMQLNYHVRESYHNYMEYLIDIEKSKKIPQKFIERIKKLRQIFTTENIPKSFVPMIFKSKFKLPLFNLSAADFEEMHKFAVIFFNNAIANPQMAMNFAEAAKILCDDQSPFMRPRNHKYPIKGKVLRYELITLCQINFEEHHSSANADADEDEAIGTVCFIGELFKNGIVTEKLITGVINSLEKSSKDLKVSKICLIALIRCLTYKNSNIFPKKECESSLNALADKIQQLKSICDEKTSNDDEDNSPVGKTIEFTPEPDELIIKQLENFVELLQNLKPDNFDEIAPKIKIIFDQIEIQRQILNHMKIYGISKPFLAETILKLFNFIKPSLKIRYDELIFYLRTSLLFDEINVILKNHKIDLEQAENVVNFIFVFRKVIGNEFYVSVMQKIAKSLNDSDDRLAVLLMFINRRSTEREVFHNSDRINGIREILMREASKELAGDLKEQIQKSLDIITARGNEGVHGSHQNYRRDKMRNFTRFY